MKYFDRYGFCFFLVTGVAALVTCEARTDAARVQLATAKLHRRFMQADFHGIYSQAVPALQQSMNKTGFVKQMDTLRRRISGESLQIERTEHLADFGGNVDTQTGHIFLREHHLLQSTADRCHEFIYWEINAGEAKWLAYHVRCDSNFRVQIP